MDGSDRIRKKKRNVGIYAFLLLFPILADMSPPSPSRDTVVGFVPSRDTITVFKSAFPSKPTEGRSENKDKGADTRYTIQVCTRYVVIDDVFLTGLYCIKTVRMGDLYRYIYSGYATLEEARKDLPKVRGYYPKAFIREYDGQHLGNAIDLTY